LRILIIGASGFLGQSLFKELNAYFDVFGTYFSSKENYADNQRFLPWDLQTEGLEHVLKTTSPDIIITCFKGPFPAQLEAYNELLNHVIRYRKKLLFISTSNVFDAFSNYPSYEYDKTLSSSIYGRFLIKIENSLLRLPNEYYNILRLPMVFGKFSPRLKEIFDANRDRVPIDVFPKVVINATSAEKFSQQVHYIINQNLKGVFHLGSTDLIHHKDLIEDICDVNEIYNPIFKNNYESNEDRYLALLPKHNPLPDHKSITVDEVVKACKMI
jgi:dTDP-4-dehydrorhamnose reductase